MKKLISVAVAVYNEEKYLSKTLDSLLAQNYSNLEIIISDNASTDKTEEIAREYVKKDGRIKYYRNEKNIGGSRNFNKALALVSGEYFMIIGGHDLLDKKYISSCAEILDKNKSVILVYSFINFIDDHNNILKRYSYINDMRHKNILLRVHYLLFNLLRSNPTMGLIKSDIIKKTDFLRNFKDVLNNDTIFFVQLSLLGEFAQIPKPLVSFRVNRLEEKIVEFTRRHIRNIYSENNQNYPLFFYIFHQFYIYLLVIFTAPVSWYYKPPLFLVVLFEVSLLYLKAVLKIIFKKNTWI